MHTNLDFPLPRINFPANIIGESESLHFSGFIYPFSDTFIKLSSRIVD